MYAILSKIPLLLAVLICVGSISANAAGTPALPLTAETLERGLAVEGSRFRPGDDSRWAEPSFPDDDWKVVPADGRLPQELIGSDGDGVAWYRIHLEIDPEVVGRPVAISIHQGAASELYLDGALLERFGVVSADPAEEEPLDPHGVPHIITFDRPGHHVIALRFSCSGLVSEESALSRYFRIRSFHAGPAIRIAGPQTAIAAYGSDLAYDRATLFFVSGAYGIFGVLHLLLFLLLRREMASLLFAFSTFALVTYLVIINTLASRPASIESVLTYYPIWGTALKLHVLFFLAFLHQALFPRRSIAGWLAAGAALVALAFLMPITPPGVLLVSERLTIVGFTLANIVLVAVALVRRVEGAWILALGGMFLSSFALLSVLSLLIAVPSGILQVQPFIAAPGLLICVSVFMARRVQRMELNERQALEANRAKSAFLAAMSHELRTPLNAVLGFAQLMEQKPDRSPEDREHLAIIRRSGEHLLGLINDVLSISKIEAGRMAVASEPFDLRRTLRSVEDVAKPRADAKHLGLHVELSGALPPFVRGDEGKLRQVLINIVGNAVKFTGQGEVVIRAEYADGEARFAIRDSGPGIAREELGRLFEAFSQTATGVAAGEGTGLGLAISRSLVRLMGGELSVASEIGRGTTFSFRIPLPAAEAPEQEPTRAEPVRLAAGEASRRILVVDDVAENRRLLSEILLGAGFAVRLAEDGHQALAAWEEWHPELILMDMRMPGLDGYEATARIRAAEAARGLHTPVLALTASAFEHDREEVLAAGCDDFLSKPFIRGDILRAIGDRLSVEFSLALDEARAAAAVAPAGSPPQPGLEAITVSSLRAALLDGNRAAATEAIETIRGLDASLAGELSEHVRAFRFGDALDLLERTDRCRQETSSSSTTTPTT